jgi:hypothetical protein
MDGNKTVTATFTQDEYTLTINKTGSGSVAASPEKATYHYGEVVTLTPTADAGWTFSAFSGDTTTNSITMDGNKTVTATFTMLTYTITASAGANGSIDPSGDVTKDHGTSQLFTATPSAGYEVDKWSVDDFEVQTGGTAYTLSDITAIHTVSVTFKLSAFIISGYIIEPDGSTPVAGVTVDANNNGGNLGITDANGYYEVTVPPGWSGTVTPIKAGFSFEPYKMVYKNVTASAEKDYAATPLAYILSGHVLKLDGTPISDVNVAAENGGGPYTTKYGEVSNDGGPCLGRLGSGSAVTDVNGYYEVMVDYNWSGKVMPSKYAYVFESNSRSYANVVADQNDQDYTGKLLTFAISGYIRNDCNVPIAGVLVDANAGGGEAITDVNGFYEVWVDYNWSGTVTSSKAHYTFEPTGIEFTDVLENKAAQDYAATNIYDLDCDGSIGYGDIAVIGENWLSNNVDIHDGDFNDDGIVNFLDFVDFALVW